MAIKRIKAISLVLALLWAILEMQIENPAHKSSQTECGKEFVCVCLFVCLFLSPFSTIFGKRRGTSEGKRFENSFSFFKGMQTALSTRLFQLSLPNLFMHAIALALKIQKTRNLNVSHFISYFSCTCFLI